MGDFETIVDTKRVE